MWRKTNPFSDFNVPEIIEGLYILGISYFVQVALHTEPVNTLRGRTRPAHASKDKQPTVVGRTVFHDGYSRIPPFIRADGPKSPERIITRGPSIDPSCTSLASAFLTRDFFNVLIRGRCALKKGYVHVVGQVTVFK
jgi:hypothetical protein